MNEKQHDHRVSVRELAELLRVSTDTIRWAYRKGELPAIRVKTALRFDLEEVHRVMQRQAAPIGAHGEAPRAALADRTKRQQPPLSKTGALIPGT